VGPPRAPLSSRLGENPALQHESFWLCVNAYLAPSVVGELNKYGVEKKKKKKKKMMNEVPEVEMALLQNATFTEKDFFFFFSLPIHFLLSAG
jgi:hypothetical protein